jgi:glutathione S-transferase
MKIEGTVRLPAGAKLYYIPMACSLAAHIVAREADLALELVRVEPRTKRTETGEDYVAIQPRGYVPALALDGEVHTEAAALLPYLADQAPASPLLPAAGTKERFRVQQWLAFVSSELHKVISPWLWDAGAAESTKQASREMLAVRFAELDARLRESAYLTGDAFTVADAYAFAVLNWMRVLKIDLAAHPNLAAYVSRIAARPKVREALSAELPHLDPMFKAAL